MTNNNSKCQKSVSTPPKVTFGMSDQLDNIALNESESAPNDQKEQICVDVNNSAIDEEIPEEVWEKESEEGVQERRVRTSQPTESSQRAVQIRESPEDSKGLRNLKLCFGYKLHQFKWFNITWLIVLHTYAIFAYGVTLWYPVNFWTVFWTVVLACGSGFGASAGAHRLWAHRAFKARWLLRFFLVIIESMAVNGSCFSYARDHRNHHKFVDTDADPKNARRGFFFAHIGWWCVKKNEQVLQYGRKLSHKDLLDDSLLVFQHKFYYPMVIFWAFIFPVILPYYAWNEDLLTAFNVCVVLRIVFVLHHLFTVNSIAHIFGKRPYDKNIGPTESKLTMYLSLGEGSHNYHHSFPMDYSNCEKKWWEVFNPSTLFIDTCELLGLAYDLKKPSHQVIQGLIQRKGEPEYFERKMKRSLCTRITLGFIDWVFGICVALWPVWLGVCFKILSGRPAFVFVEEEIAT